MTLSCPCCITQHQREYPGEVTGALEMSQRVLVLVHAQEVQKGKISITRLVASQPTHVIIIL